MNYRARIYADYASIMQHCKLSADNIATNRWGRAYRHYLRDWLPDNMDASIADLACGSGRLLHLLNNLGYTRLHGVDMSPSQVRLARRVVQNVVEGSVFDFLAAEKGKYELLTGLDIVEHLRKDEVLEFLNACFMALKPGGRLVLQTPNAETPWGSVLRYADFTHETCFTPECLSRLLLLCGFEKTTPRELGPVPFGYSLASTLRYFLWIAIRSALRNWNRIETGSPGSGIFTRVFIISGLKPESKTQNGHLCES